MISSTAKMRPMNTAPRDGTRIEVYANGSWWPVRYHDCTWLREGKEGDPNVTDAWAVEGAEAPGYIELDEAEGWMPSDHRGV